MDFLNTARKRRYKILGYEVTGGKENNKMHASLKQDYFLTSNVCLVKATPGFNCIE